MTAAGSPGEPAARSDDGDRWQAQRGLRSEPVGTDELIAIPPRYALPVSLLAGGLVLWWVYAVEPTPYRPLHLLGSGLAALVLLAAQADGWVRSGRRGEGERRLALGGQGAAAVALLLLGAQGPGALGLYLVVVNAPALGPLGAVVAAAVWLFYAFQTVAGALAQHHLEMTPLAAGLLGPVLAYLGSACARMLRRERVRQATQLERERLAREVHDVLAHTLSALAVQLEAARALAQQRPGDPAVEATLGRCQHLVREGLVEARRAVATLRGDDLPGPEQLSRLAEDFERDTGIPCRLEVEGRPARLAPDARLAVYRAAQEALSNVRKHAEATEVRIRLAYRRSDLDLTVEDRGRPKPALSPGGYGLSGIRERVAFLGGTLEAGPVDGGFRVRLSVPV
jgi:signal transduction histidine kinase